MTTFIIDRTRVLKGISPYELLHNKLSSYGELNVFGSLRYVSNIPHHRTKLSTRPIPRVFIGYPRGYKGYKAYDIESQKIYIFL